MFYIALIHWSWHEKRILDGNIINICCLICLYCLLCLECLFIIGLSFSSYCLFVYDETDNTEKTKNMVRISHTPCINKLSYQWASRAPTRHKRHFLMLLWRVNGSWVACKAYIYFYDFLLSHCFYIPCWFSVDFSGILNQSKQLKTPKKPIKSRLFKNYSLFFQKM